ncbi:hypothetical protein AMELA_G00087700 [Ameiurus melas]|uniref:Neurexin/syndecan/glycophorin C domain-containing protein n=1 Tax=Ameiurus melas TaxID=219545 RepID=A0A7J6AXQ2_AMEME|nr:hypothetical protein AMELA_G00087700 [Ameiurus melas]
MKFFQLSKEVFPVQEEEHTVRQLVARQFRESCCPLQSFSQTFPRMLLRPDSMRMTSNATELAENMDDSDNGIFNVIIGAVIAVVVLVFICLLVVLFRYMYQHKGTYHTNEAKGSEFAETADAALQGDPALQDAMDESKKEYFI